LTLSWLLVVPVQPAVTLLPEAGAQIAWAGVADNMIAAKALAATAAVRGNNPGWSVELHFAFTDWPPDDRQKKSNQKLWSGRSSRETE
jgi:hypothetical protein